MKIKRIMKKIISGLLILVLTGGWYSDACMVKADCVKANDEFSLIDVNEFVISPEPIMEIDNGRYKAYFSYDSNKTRISKEYNEKQTCYKYNQNLLVAESGVHNLEFFYEDDDRGFSRCEQLSIDGVLYSLCYDDTNNVSSMTNDEEELICTYVYNGAVVETFDKDGKCRDEDEEFVGVINPFRYQGWYYDSELKHYYLGEGIYYNALIGEYVNNPYKVNEEKLDEFLMTYSSEPMIIRYIVNDYTGYMSQTNYGSTSFPDNYVTESQWNSGRRWYTTLTQVEVMARCIYGENNTLAPKNGPNDRVAIAAVIMNRVNGGMASSTYGAVVAYDEFYTINPGSYQAYLNDTRLARQSRSKTDEAWKQATLMACVLHNTISKTELGYMATMPSYINTQMYFCSLNASYNESRFTYSNGVWTYRGTAVANLALAGTASLDNATVDAPLLNPSEKAKQVIGPYRNQGYNIFFNY